MRVGAGVEGVGFEVGAGLGAGMGTEVGFGVGSEVGAGMGADVGPKLTWRSCIGGRLVRVGAWVWRD